MGAPERRVCRGCSMLDWTPDGDRCADCIAADTGERRHPERLPNEPTETCQMWLP